MAFHIQSDILIAQISGMRIEEELIRDVMEHI